MKIPRDVYALRHNVTNRVYIGSTCNITKRLKKHLRDLQNHCHSVEDMQEDFDKYGDDFTVTILDTIQEYEEKDKEYLWMIEHRSNVRGIGYNYKDHYKFEKHLQNA